MVAAEVYGLSGIDFSAHQDYPIFEGHGEVDFVVAVERKDSLDNCVVRGVKP